MDGLITFFEILVAIMIVIFVIVVVGTLITGYGLSDADMKEYYRREEEKRRKKLARRPRGHWEFNGGSLSSYWVPDKEADLIDIGRY